MASFYGSSYVLFVAMLKNGSADIFEVSDPEKNLEFKVVWRPFYEAHGFERFKVKTATMTMI